MAAKRSGGGIWLRQDGADGRTRRPRLSRERITEAAIGLLDAEGADGFSMRRLAARLGAGTMSLYEYIAGKEDAFDLALDAVMAEIEPAGAVAERSWRAVVTGQVMQSRAVMRRHPWVPELVGTRPLLGPNSLARSESFHAALAATGLPDRQVAAAVGAVTGYVDGYVLKENTWRTRFRDTGEDADLRRRTREHLVAHGDAYPALSMYARLGEVEEADFDGAFVLGLEIVLDGVEARIGVHREHEVGAWRAEDL